MYPELFTIPGINYTISTFGVMMSLGFLAGYWITCRRMTELGLDPEPVTNLLIWIMIGAVVSSVGGSMIPAVVAAMTDPAQSLRYE